MTQSMINDTDYIKCTLNDAVYIIWSSLH